jgi:endonuclease/exonuclease/phosphatase family metal-dependent hydrolase
MVVVSWNCGGALRKKFAVLQDLLPDVCVVQECEDPSRSASTSYREWAENSLWVPKDWLSTSTIEVGTHERWLEYSDHMPIRVKIDALRSCHDAQPAVAADVAPRRR